MICCALANGGVLATRGDACHVQGLLCYAMQTSRSYVQVCAQFSVVLRCEACNFVLLLVICFVVKLS